MAKPDIPLDTGTTKPSVTTGSDTYKATTEEGTAGDDILRIQFAKTLGLSFAFELNDSRK